MYKPLWAGCQAEGQGNPHPTPADAPAVDCARLWGILIEVLHRTQNYFHVPHPF